MNNIVSIVNNEAVTTSLAIADGVGNPHKSVIRLIRDNVNDFNEFGRVRFEMRPFETAGGPQNKEYAILNEQQSALLLTYFRNNDTVKAFKKALIKAFFEMRDALNNRKANPADMSRIEILQLAMESEQERIKLEHKIEEDAPLVAFAKKVEVSPDAISVAKAAKIIGTGQRRLFSFLRQIGWVTRKNEPYQAKIESGYLDVKLGSWDHPDHGLQQAVTTLIRGKGLTKLQALWEQQQKEHAA